MKVLWLSGNPSLYKNDFFNGGWIGSLEHLIKNENGIELAISFPHSDRVFKVAGENVTYYPISIENTKNRIVKFFNADKYDLLYIDQLNKVIEDFKPDIIHVWGSELQMGLIGKYTKIPVVMHIQGLLSPIFLASFPPGFNLCSYVLHSKFNLKRIYKSIRGYFYASHCVKREQDICRHIHYFMGRTEWDKHVIEILSPRSEYFYCSEMIRPNFFLSKKWKYHDRNKIIIVSILSDLLSKGQDLILNTSKILKENMLLDFEWRIIGLNDIVFFEKVTGLRAKDYNIKCLGRMNATEVVDVLLESDVYVHPSYIENSPNSICEAQALGVPVIGSMVGGVASLVEDGKTGILLPANDSFSFAYYIQVVKNDLKLSNKLSDNEVIAASQRHDSKIIVSNLIENYNKIIRR